MEMSSGREAARRDLIATWEKHRGRRVGEQDIAHVKDVATQAAVHLLWRDLLDLGRRAREEGGEEDGSLLELCAGALVSLYKSVLVHIEGRRTDGCSLLAVAMATTSAPGLRVPVCAELCVRLVLVAGVEDKPELKVALITANAMVAAIGIDALSKLREGAEWYAFGDLWSDPAAVFAQAKMLSDATRSEAFEATQRALRNGHLEEILNGVTEAVMEASPALGLLYASTPRDGSAMTETVVFFRMSCAESLWDFEDFETVSADARVRNVALMVSCFGPVYRSAEARKILAWPVVQGFLTWTRRRMRDLEGIDPEGFSAFVHADGELAALTRRMLEIESAESSEGGTTDAPAGSSKSASAPTESEDPRTHGASRTTAAEQMTSSAGRLRSPLALVALAACIGGILWGSLSLHRGGHSAAHDSEASTLNASATANTLTPSDASDAPASVSEARWAEVLDRQDCATPLRGGSQGGGRLDEDVIVQAVVPRARRGRAPVARVTQGSWPTFAMTGCRGVVAQADRAGRIALTSQEPLAGGRLLVVLTTRTQAAGGDDEGNGFLAVLHARAGRVLVDGVTAWSGQAHQFRPGARAINLAATPGLLVSVFEAGTNDGGVTRADVMALQDGLLVTVGTVTLESSRDGSCFPGSESPWHAMLRRTVTPDETGLRIRSVRRWELGSCVERAAALPPLAPVERVTEHHVPPNRDEVAAFEAATEPEPPLPAAWRSLWQH